MNSCQLFSNFVKADDETIFEKSGNSALEIRKLRESLVARRKYNRASAFMQLELTLVQGLEIKASVGASLGLCSVMEETENRALLFRSAKLGQQLSGILEHIIPQIGEQVSQHSVELLRQIFPQMEAQCPGMSFDIAVKLVRDSPSTEGEKSQKYMDLSHVASERMDFTRANQALIAARDAADKNYHQCKTLPSGRAALQHLHDFYTAYIDLHQIETGMAFFESSGVAGYLSLLFVCYKDFHKILQIFEDFQGRYVDFGIPSQQERMFDLATKAAKTLALKEKLQLYSKQHFKWLKQCPFADQLGRLTESGLADTEQHIRQISGGAEDPIEWGSNAMQLILTWAKIEGEKGLLTTGGLREHLSFVQIDGQDDDPDFLQYIGDLDFEDAAKNLYGDLDEPTPSVTFLDIMQRLANWLNLPDRPPSQAARLAVAKIIMISRLQRHRLHLARKGIPDPTDIIEYSEEQKLLDTIEKLEDAVGGGFGDQLVRQMASRIQITVTKCYVPEAVNKQLITDEELRSRISDCLGLVSKYANGGRRFLEYYSLCQQSRLRWQQYILLKSVPADASLEVLERAELLFNDARKQTLRPEPADLFSATIDLNEEFMSQVHSKMGIMASFVSFSEKLAASQKAQVQGASNVELDDIAFHSYERFLKWTHRSKGRGLIDLLYFDVEVAQDLVGTLTNGRGRPIKSGAESDLPSLVENLHIAENITLHGETEQAQPSTDRATPTVLSQDATDDTMVSKAMINEMLSKVGDDVVLVDIINIANLGEGGSQAILYRKGTTTLPIPLPEITLQAVEGWVEKNLGSKEKSIGKPLCEGYASALQELTPLLMPLFNPESPQSRKAKETIIFCLTGALHRIPIHAIPINGVPLIESHPVTYCQSLTTLYRGYGAVCKFQRSTPGIESLAIVPSYEQWWMNEAAAEESLQREIEGISRGLNAKPCSGSDLTKKTVQNALFDCAHVLYIGHVHYDFKSPNRSALLLNELAYKDPSLRIKPGSESLAVRDLFKIRLRRPALATIIGCGSGQAQISDSDDILGLPSALLFAGASAIVSTLWPIDPDDGATFAAAFYHTLDGQQKPGGKRVGLESGLTGCVNLACAMHEAVKVLRQRGERKNVVYHWAAFYLAGFWLFPPLLFSD